jgi:hypothetical protein
MYPLVRIDLCPFRLCSLHGNEVKPTSERADNSAVGSIVDIDRIAHALVHSIIKQSIVRIKLLHVRRWIGENIYCRYADNAVCTLILSKNKWDSSQPY